MTDTITKARELVARLRRGVTWSDGAPIGAVVGEVNDPVMLEAADFIESLTEPMSEDEALERAREAAASVTRAKQYRDPEAGLDSQLVIKAAVHALIHAHEPLPVEDEDALDMCAHGADRGSYCGYCGGYSKGAWA
jgi:hypothetical protein